MSLEQWASLAEIVASVGFIVSLLFVGYQIRQNTSLLQRNEHNSTMAQWSAIRHALIKDRGVAELWTSGLNDEPPLDPADRLRLDALLTEHLWAGYHVWERTRRGILSEGNFNKAVAPLVREWLVTPRGGRWWARARRAFPPRFVSDVDSVLESAGPTATPTP